MGDGAARHRSGLRGKEPCSVMYILRSHFLQLYYLKWSPSAVAIKMIISFSAYASVHAGTGGTLALTTNPNSVETPWVLGSLANQIHNNSVEDKCS